MSISGENLSLSPEADLDELIQDTSLLIASVYDMFGRPQRSPRQAQTTLGRRSHNNSDSSGQLGSSSNTSNSSTPKSPKTPRLGNSNRAVIPSTPSSREIDQEINRIDRFCEMLEHNLRSGTGAQNQILQGPLDLSSPTSLLIRAGRSSLDNAAANATNSPTVEEVIDLCDSMSMPAPLPRRALNLSDDVIIVTPTDDEIVDLCTPNHRRITARTRNNNYNRRSINFNGSTNNCRSGNEPRSRMRAASRSLSSSNSSSTHCSNESRSSRCSISTTTSTTNMNPSVTAATKVASKNKSPDANCDNSDDGTNDNGRVPLMCAVCMESCVSNQPTSTKCGHVFCANCIRQAVRLTRKCPMCNTKLTANMLFRIYV